MFIQYYLAMKMGLALVLSSCGSPTTPSLSSWPSRSALRSPVYTHTRTHGRLSPDFAALSTHSPRRRTFVIPPVLPSSRKLVSSASLPQLNFNRSLLTPPPRATRRHHPRQHRQTTSYADTIKASCVAFDKRNQFRANLVVSHLERLGRRAERGQIGRFPGTDKPNRSEKHGPTAYEALESSGYVPNATPTSRPETFDCYMGVATEDYVHNLRDEMDVYYSTGTLRAFLSGRISFAMQLGGSLMAVDTACSSSNVAVYLGAHVSWTRPRPLPQSYWSMQAADGYSRSEGCGVFVLKRLGDAITENDTIAGVIRGIEVNQSGLAHSIPFPHAPTQAALFSTVLDSAGIDASRVNVVEAHGSGTQAGHPNEVENLRSVQLPPRPFPLQILS
ncbi:thiolase-like protein [Favolaschia claudopus]|uniref:Thiolase-like protein n=1 Tax=Favolaschia claudopus TaxID=2862362 RepID=A0AAW0ANB3_9AGAR